MTRSVLVQVTLVFLVPWVGSTLGDLLRPVKTLANIVILPIGTFGAVTLTYVQCFTGYAVAMLLARWSLSLLSVRPHWAFFAVLVLRRVLLEWQLLKTLRLSGRSGMVPLELAGAAGDVSAILIFWFRGLR